MPPAKRPSPAAARAASRPASSHDRILGAAKHLFATRGYESTSTVAIARAAGTSESQLMKHFGSKEGLLEAIFEQGWAAMAHIFSRIHDLDTPADKLQTLIELVLNALERDPDLKLLMLLEGRRIRKEGHMVVLTQGFLAFVKSIDGILLEMRARGELRTDVPPEAVRSALMGMFEGMMRDRLLAERIGFAAPFSVADIKKTFQMALRSLKP
jgi:AcrR family transcriptional regulator